MRHPDLARMSRLRLLICLLFAPAACAASMAASPDGKKPLPMSAKTFEGLKLRSIGPAFMSGRIADIAIHPLNPSVWYVGVGSGGVWKTENRGTTWKSIFDGQGSYSIGAVAIDPSHPHTLWVGTGENVGGRHVGYGDGVYRSDDGGKKWRNLGLKKTERISEIIIHPENSKVVWVASQGPLWSPGGERGLYKTTDGGKTWKRVLSAGPYTGVTDIALDPRNPDVMYAATWQRHRTVAAYMGGGPESGLHKSIDGGETWQKLTEGLPEGNLGKIGLAVSPVEPDIVYAAIELNRRKGGLWRSVNGGALWEKRSDAVSGGTGPHYYQELYASPHAAGTVYLADVRMQISEDGGKTFRQLEEKYKHSDNHALVFRADDPAYLLVGTDGGLYETFDRGKHWRFIDNLPLTQFYKVAVDDTEPFYFVYGGTQDNNTQGGPSRTANINGIRNADWFVILGGDGHQPATEPGNPAIVYAEAQQGVLHRIDRTTGERVYIQPQPEPGDPPERFNWDSPILVSPHSPTRLYFASQRLWRSDNRGDSWKAVSGDLTRNQERVTQPIMGRRQSWDAPWDMWAMSLYGTITSVSESPLQEGLLYVGTDDGLIQVSENGGQSWRSVDVGDLPGVPDTAFVNDIKADLHDPNTVYIALDDHKSGNFSPFLLKSTNRGRSWTSIRGDLPERHLVWRVVQDHVKPTLLFAGTEFGVFFTVDGGRKWIKLQGDAPTISFRDLAIQRRENDLVGATFGRGFWILDDYSPLRDVSKEALEQAALLFAPRAAPWYIERRPLGGDEKSMQGAGYFTAPNPPFGATFTYYLKDALTTREQRRQEEEKPRLKDNRDMSFPGWETVETERREPKPTVVLTIEDSEGNPIRRVSGPIKAGMHRITWDLRYPATQAIGQKPDYPYARAREPKGVMAAPGRYTATLVQTVDGTTTPLAGPVNFDVVRTTQGALEGAEPAATVAFWRRLATVGRGVSAAALAIKTTHKRFSDLETALKRSESQPDGLDRELHTLKRTLDDIERALAGHKSKRAIGDPDVPSIGDRLGAAAGNTGSTYGPTPMHQRSLQLAEAAFAEVRVQLNTLLQKSLPEFEARLTAAGAPWVPGQPVPALP